MTVDDVDWATEEGLWSRDIYMVRDSVVLWLGRNIFYPFATELKGSTEKAQKVLERLQEWLAIPFFYMKEQTRSFVGQKLRDPFLFPLAPYFEHEQMQIEIKYCRDFWDPKRPLILT